MVRVPASSANLGPGLRRVRGGAVAPPGARGGGDRRGRSSVECDSPGVPCDRSNLVRARVRGAAPGRRADASGSGRRSRCRPGSGRPPPRSSPGSWPPTTCTSWTRRCSSWPPSSRGIPTTWPPRCYGGFVICTRDGPPVRFDPRAGPRGRARDPAANRWRTVEARAALPAEVPMADAVHNPAHARAARARAGARRPRPRRPRAVRPHPPAAPRAPLPALDGAGGARRASSARWARRSPAPGPTVLFWCDWEQTGALFEALRAEARECEVRRARFAPGGADVRAL